MRLALFAAFALGVFATGCVTKTTLNRTYPTAPRERRLRLAQSIPTDTPAGTTYEVRVYIVQVGDTFSKVVQRSGLSEQEFLTLNPGIRVRKLKINERVVFYERTYQ